MDTTIEGWNGNNDDNAYVCMCQKKTFASLLQFFAWRVASDSSRTSIVIPANNIDEFRVGETIQNLTMKISDIAKVGSDLFNMYQSAWYDALIDSSIDPLHI